MRAPQGSRGWIGVSTAIIVAWCAGARAETPPGLACLARHYTVTPVEDSGRWYGRLPDGTRVPWNDGRKKTLAQALDAPDLQDMLARFYRPGPLRPVTDPDDDPGRVRVSPLFAATYPTSGIVTVGFLGHRLKVHERAAAAFQRVADRLATLRGEGAWLARFSGTFVVRPIAGTARPSSHGWGISIDLDAQKTAYWRWDHPPRWHNAVPQTIVDAFEAEGFVWGGRWYHYDTMHFEWRPELFDCAASANE